MTASARIFRRLLCAGLLAVWPLAARAEHFEITLTVEGPHDKAEAFADSCPPAGGFHPRPIFHGAAGELLSFQFLMTDVNPHATMKRVTVRYYVAPEARLGQKEPPRAGPDAVVAGEFLLDFKPNARAGLRQQVRIDKPGSYLLRVESSGSQADHEHFSAIDLDIRN